MKTKILAILILIELASMAYLLYLLRQPAVPDKIGVTLVWLLPISLGLHVVEEFFFPGGLMQWDKDYRPQFEPALKPMYYFRINAIGMAASILTSLGASSFIEIRLWLAFTMVFPGYNSFWHIWGAIRSRRYCPGMLTSLVLYLPLTVISLAYFLRTGRLDVISALVCIALAPFYQLVSEYFHRRNLKKLGINKPLESD